MNPKKINKNVFAKCLVERKRQRWNVLWKYIFIYYVFSENTSNSIRKLMNPCIILNYTTAHDRKKKSHTYHLITYYQQLNVMLKDHNIFGSLILTLKTLKNAITRIFWWIVQDNITVWLNILWNFVVSKIQRQTMTIHWYNTNVWDWTFRWIKDIRRCEKCVHNLLYNTHGEWCVDYYGLLWKVTRSKRTHLWYGNHKIARTCIIITVPELEYDC